MRIDVVSLFPPMFDGVQVHGVAARAIKRELLQFEVTDPRQFATNKYRTVDDYPYGGGPGMVLMPDPLFMAVESLECSSNTPVILMTPQGRPFTQAIAHELAALPHMVLVCGHFEGFDERIGEHLATDELSIGDYVLGGGEIPAMVVTDAVARLLPGAMDAQSATEESHAGHLLEYPQYTRPPEYRGWSVPDILLSGNHGAVAAWRREQSIRKTFDRRPDLLQLADLTPKEWQMVDRWRESDL